MIACTGVKLKWIAVYPHKLVATLVGNYAGCTMTPYVMAVMGIIGWCQVYYVNTTCNHELHNYICIHALGFRVELVAYKWWMNCRIRLQRALHMVSLAKVCAFLFLLLRHNHQKNSHSVPRSVMFVFELVILPPICNERMYRNGLSHICNHRGLLIQNLRFIPIWFGEFLLPIWLHEINFSQHVM